MSDGRANQLRERRNKSSNPDQPGNTDNSENPDNEPKPVKQRRDWRALQIQLPDDLRDELELLLDETNLELKRDGEDGLEKFMHFYPLLVSAGLERIEEMDVDERRRRAKEFE